MFEYLLIFFININHIIRETNISLKFKIILLLFCISLYCDKLIIKARKQHQTESSNRFFYKLAVHKLDTN